MENKPAKVPMSRQSYIRARLWQEHFVLAMFGLALGKDKNMFLDLDNHWEYDTQVAGSMADEKVPPV